MPLELNVTLLLPVVRPEISHLNLSFAGLAAVTVAGVLGRAPEVPAVTFSGAVAGGPLLGPENAAASAST